MRRIKRDPTGVKEHAAAVEPKENARKLPEASEDNAEGPSLLSADNINSILTTPFMTGSRETAKKLHEQSCHACGKEGY